MTRKTVEIAKAMLEGEMFVVKEVAGAGAGVCEQMLRVVVRGKGRLQIGSGLGVCRAM